jgi:hypothetical protein
MLDAHLIGKKWIGRGVHDRQGRLTSGFVNGLRYGCCVPLVSNRSKALNSPITRVTRKGTSWDTAGGGTQTPKTCEVTELLKCLSV